MASSATGRGEISDMDLAKSDDYRLLVFDKAQGHVKQSKVDAFVRGFALAVNYDKGSDGQTYTIDGIDPPEDDILVDLTNGGVPDYIDNGFEYSNGVILVRNDGLYNVDMTFTTDTDFSGLVKVDTTFPAKLALFKDDGTVKAATYITSTFKSAWGVLTTEASGILSLKAGDLLEVHLQGSLDIANQTVKVAQYTLAINSVLGNGSTGAGTGPSFVSITGPEGRSVNSLSGPSDDGSGNLYYLINYSDSTTGTAGVPLAPTGVGVQSIINVTGSPSEALVIFTNSATGILNLPTGPTGAYDGGGYISYALPGDLTSSLVAFDSTTGVLDIGGPRTAYNTDITYADGWYTINTAGVYLVHLTAGAFASWDVFAAQYDALDPAKLAVCIDDGSAVTASTIGGVLRPTYGGYTHQSQGVLTLSAGDKVGVMKSGHVNMFDINNNPMSNVAFEDYCLSLLRVA